jgi:Collagen triple helix repeat (20 copies)
MSLCASCGVDRSIGCEHFESTDFAGLQEKIIEVSEAAAGEKKVAPRSAAPVPDEAKPYVPGQRDYQAASVQAEQRGPSVMMSRGPAGPAGPAGATGLPGKDGKDADLTEAIELATRTMESRLAKFEASVADLLTKTLQRAGVIDQNGRAILLPGKDGRDGANGRDSVVPGPQGLTGARGERGEQGERGERGEQGERGPTGATGAQGPRGEKGNQGDPGPQGERGEKGTSGPRGGAGDISAALANMSELLDQRLAAFREELKGEK